MKKIITLALGIIALTGALCLVGVTLLKEDVVTTDQINEVTAEGSWISNAYDDVEEFINNIQFPWE